MSDIEGLMREVTEVQERDLENPPDLARLRAQRLAVVEAVDRPGRGPRVWRVGIPLLTAAAAAGWLLLAQSGRPLHVAPEPPSAVQASPRVSREVPAAPPIAPESPPAAARSSAPAPPPRRASPTNERKNVPRLEPRSLPRAGKTWPLMVTTLVPWKRSSGWALRS